MGDSVLTRGTVVLHHLTDERQGELDSVPVAPDGTFSFELPNVPDPARGDVFFASLRHDGVLYFGPAITNAVELDSIYEIRAYDTILAPAGGASLALESRSLFFEPTEGAWRVTDLFQIRNDLDRTFVARDGGRTWSYPLPEAARNVSAGEGSESFDAATYEGGEVVVRAAIAPGERLFVVRYELDSPYVPIPTPGPIEGMDVLVREPAPPLTLAGFELLDRIELEPGSSYQRFAAADVNRPTIELAEAEGPRRPPVAWAMVILALVLTAAGLFVMMPRASTTRVAATDRTSILTRVAMLDEEFHSAGERTPSERKAYERERARLLARLRGEE